MNDVFHKWKVGDLLWVNFNYSTFHNKLSGVIEITGLNYNDEWYNFYHFGLKDSYSNGFDFDKQITKAHLISTKIVKLLYT